MNSKSMNVLIIIRKIKSKNGLSPESGLSKKKSLETKRIQGFLLVEAGGVDPLSSVWYLFPLNIQKAYISTNVWISTC